MATMFLVFVGTAFSLLLIPGMITCENETLGRNWILLLVGSVAQTVLIIVSSIYLNNHKQNNVRS